MAKSHLLRCKRLSQGGRRCPETPQNLPMHSGKKSRPCSLSPRRRPGVVPSRSPIVPALRGFCGYYAQEPAGKICPSDILPPVCAGDACEIGKSTMSGSRPGTRSWANLTHKANSIGPKPWLTAVLPQPKKGGLRWENQVG